MQSNRVVRPPLSPKERSKIVARYVTVHGEAFGPRQVLLGMTLEMLGG